MNRKLMCALLASGAAMFAGGAMAADLPSSAPAPAPYLAPPPPVFTWTGFYVGVNAGVSFNGSDNVFFDPNAAAAVNDVGSANSLNPSSNSTAGFTGGGQIGYNWQVSQFVFGLEGDLDYLNRKNLNGTYSTPAAYNYSSYTLSGSKNNQLFGTIRGRVGWAVDRALFYVTGGVAFNGNSAPRTLTFNGPGTSVYQASNNSASNVGGVVGAGIEYAFTPNWTAKVEYLHTFFNNKNLVYANTATPSQTFTTSGYNFDTNIVRVGLNYKF